MILFALVNTDRPYIMHCSSILLDETFVLPQTEASRFKKHLMKYPSKCENPLHLDIDDSSRDARDSGAVNMSLYRKFSPLYISGQADDDFYASFGQHRHPSINFSDQKGKHTSSVESLSSDQIARFEHAIKQPLNILSTDARCYIDNISDIRESATARAVAFLRAYESQLEALFANYTFSSNHQTPLNTSGVHELHPEIASHQGSVIGSAVPISLGGVLSQLRGNLTMLVTIVSAFYPSVPTTIQFIVQSVMEHCDYLEDQISLMYKDSTSLVESDAHNITPPISNSFASNLTIGPTSTMDVISRLSHNNIDQALYTPLTPSIRYSTTNMAQTLYSMPRSIVKADEWNESCDRPDRQLFLKKITSIPGCCTSEKSCTDQTSSNFNLFNEPTDLSDKCKEKEKEREKERERENDKCSSVDVLKTVAISHTEATSESVENVEGQVYGSHNTTTSTMINTASLLLPDSPPIQKGTSDVITLTKICSIPGLPGRVVEPQMITSPPMDMSGDDTGNKMGNQLNPRKAKATAPNDDPATYLFEEGRNGMDDIAQKTPDLCGAALTSAEGVIHNMLDFVKLLYNERIVKASNDIYVELSRRIKQNDCVIVFGKSRIVLKALILAHLRLQAETDSKACFEVICIDASECQCGLDIIKKLSQAGIPCFYGLLTSLPLFIKHATKVIMGAHSVSLNGSIQGRAGASLIANIAKFYRIPLIVGCETYKVTDQIYINALSNNVLQDTGTFTLGQTDKIQIIKPLYDTVDTKLISCIITEYGPISPDSLREQLK
eukprot:XP_001709984.1 Translation initiation factor eIF-2B delta subunit [Giardia lamblia ATCC 50803]